MAVDSIALCVYHLTSVNQTKILTRQQWTGKKLELQISCDVSKSSISTMIIQLMWHAEKETKKDVRIVKPAAIMFLFNCSHIISSSEPISSS